MQNLLCELLGCAYYLASYCAVAFIIHSKRQLLLAFGSMLIAMLADGAFCLAQGVRGFGPSPGRLPLRGFGNPRGEEALRLRFPEAAASVTGDDRSLALMQITRTDANGDGVVNQQEWTDSGYQNPERFRYYDLNGDGQLTLYEHSIGIAGWRRGKERQADRSQSQRTQAERQRQRTGAPAPVFVEPEAVDPQVASRGQQVRDLATYLIREHDVNQNGLLEQSEFRGDSKYKSVSGADSNSDGQIDQAEIANWLHRQLPPLSRLSYDLQAYDVNGDDQLTLTEFTDVSNVARMAEFARLDRNDDGLITPEESLLPGRRPNSYTSTGAIVIKPSGSVVSEIWVEEDATIDQVQVNVMITKETDNYVALQLVGPGRRKVTLIPGDGYQPWRGGLILNGITFADWVPEIKEPLGQPPNPRRFRPIKSKDSPGLSVFSGQQTRGMWRLVVRNQNNRSGLLAHWSLNITTRERVQ